MKFHLTSYFSQESERLFFRKLTTHDSESWQAFFEENDRLHFLGIDTSKSYEELASTWINKQLERYEHEGLGHLAVIEKKSNLLIGMGGILPRELDGEAEFEISYSIKPPFWNKGYGTEIATQMRIFGTEHHIANTFISIIEKSNIDSIKVAVKNKMSFIKETTFLGMDVSIYGVTVNKQLDTND